MPHNSRHFDLKKANQNSSFDDSNPQNLSSKESTNLEDLEDSNQQNSSEFAHSSIVSMRIDKWLWVARFFKTRSLAKDEIDKNRISVNGQIAKASKDVHLEDEIKWRNGGLVRTFFVKGFRPQRVSPVLAQQLFEETPESILERQRFADLRRLKSEPALSQSAGRPTKKDRRQLDRQTHSHQWNERFSVSLDESDSSK